MRVCIVISITCVSLLAGPSALSSHPRRYHGVMSGDDHIHMWVVGCSLRVSAANRSGLGAPPYRGSGGAPPYCSEKAIPWNEQHAGRSGPICGHTPSFLPPPPPREPAPPHPHLRAPTRRHTCLRVWAPTRRHTCLCVWAPTRRHTTLPLPPSPCDASCAPLPSQG